ncbi:MAG: hypothetical protein AB7S36_10360, partial [Planctomycetota bacterium]
MNPPSKKQAPSSPRAKRRRKNKRNPAWAGTDIVSSKVKMKTAPSKDGYDATPPDTDSGGSGDGDSWASVKMPLAEYHELYDPQLLEDEPDAPPVEFALTLAEYRGIVGKNGARITANFDLEVFAEGWTRLRLFDDRVAVTRMSVTTGGAEHITLISDYGHSLLVREPGRYHLALEFSCGFLAESGRSGVALGIPRAAVNRVALAIPRTGIDVSSRRCLDVQVRTVDKPGKDDMLTEAHTRFDGVFPPCDDLQVEWTQAIEEEEADKVAVKPQLTAEVGTLASVGEGMVVCRSKVHYDVVQGSVSRLAFRLPSDVNVLSVTSPAAKTWRVRGNDANAPGADPIHSGERNPGIDGQGLQAGPDEILLEVNLSYDVASAHDVDVVYERKMADTSGSVRVPVIDVLGVERQRGFVGVEARTNVEVSVKEQEAVARVDIQELPRPLWEVAQNPLLFGFKYLRVPWVVDLLIRKHLDVEVLVATIDSAHVEATLVEDGKLETRCLFFVRNNQQQYLRIQLPDQSTVWSTFVSNRPVKPARDAESGHLLVSLEKSRVVADLQKAFPVEIVYLTSVPKMQDHGGKLLISIPQVDVPVNHAMLRLHVPDRFRYDDWGGTMKKVNLF